MNDCSLLRTLFHYEPHSGKFYRVAKLTWKRNIHDCEPREITDTNHFGYYQVNFQGRPHAIHRLIFLYMKGQYPLHDVDHINGNRIDNRWSNLREVNRQNNLRNVGLRTDNTTGVVGVSLRKDTGKFSAYIEVNGTRIRLGNFITLQEAKEARSNAELKYGFHENHGKRLGWRSN